MTTDPAPINITIGSEGYNDIVRVDRGNKTSDGIYSFKGLDDKVYQWQPVSRVWGNRMEVRGWSFNVGEKTANGELP